MSCRGRTRGSPWSTFPNPANPSFVSLLQLNPTLFASFPFDMDFSDNYAFVPSFNDDTLHVMTSRTQPRSRSSRPSRVLALPIFSMAAGVKVLGNFAFITAVIDDSLTVVDISNPLAPTFAGHVSGAGTPNFMGGARHLHLSLGRAYVVSANDAALTVVDISDPVTPSVVAVQGAGAPNFLEIPLDVFISGNHAYVASFGDSSVPRGDNSLSIFDVGVATPADLVAAVETLVAGRPPQQGSRYGVDQETGTWARPSFRQPGNRPGRYGRTPAGGGTSIDRRGELNHCLNPPTAVVVNLSGR